ncbi:MAG TPA: hypothetical protein VMU26_16605 [Candidatus Polarisedimenticolia bacterium]|nr:hypothetical protein [Candidatus Polarisedimenticolia bacterium]
MIGAFLSAAIPDFTPVGQNGTAKETLRVHSHFVLRPILIRLLLCVFVGAAACLFVGRIYAQSSAAETPEANPGRPTVSTPATLTPVGYLQFENGGLYAEGSPEFTTLSGINQVTKLTVAPGFQLLALSAPLAHAGRAIGDALSGSRPGEVFAGFQAVVLPGEGHKPTVSLSYIRRLYASPAPELDIGTFKNSALILLSYDLAGFHFDMNGIFSEQTKGIIRRGQFGQTFSIPHSLGRLTAAGELWHFTQPLINRNAVGILWAVSYPVRKNLVVDAGFNHGLTSSSTQWGGFAGFTYLLPHRLWGVHGPK